MSTFVIVLLAIVSLFQRPGEKNIFSFKTAKGKELRIMLNESSGKLIYRYGTSSKIELEFTCAGDDNKDFIYSYYLRPGGIENAGLDLNYLRFSIDEFTYWVYELQSAESSNPEIGVRIFKKDKQIAKIEGDPATIEGSLVSIRFMDNVLQDDILLD